MGKSYTHLSLVERALLQTQLVLRWSPAAIAAGLQRARSTITREMARHEDLSERTGLKVYFAHPHSPWERGRNENTNGLLRQYLPKGEDLSGYSQLQLDDIAASLNARPRKSLGWKAPAELFLPKGAFDFKKYWSNENAINRVALGA